MTVFLLNFALSIPTYAGALEQKDLLFKINAEALMKGDLEYHVDLLSPKKLLSKYPEFSSLDSLKLLEQKKPVLFSKVAFVVKRPSGFFDHQHMTNEKFVSHIMGEQQVRKVSDNDFEITVPGEDGHNYRMKTYFDSDDVSTLPNSRVTQAVTTARKLDVISQSATSMVFREFTDYTKHSSGGVSVISYVPLKHDRTLIISYSLWGLKENHSLSELKSSLVEENLAIKKLIESYE